MEIQKKQNADSIYDMHMWYGQLLSALRHASDARSVLIVEKEAERLGLHREDCNGGIWNKKWNLDVGRSRLTLSWRWYDPSGPFNYQPDINVFVLALFEDDQELRCVELRFAD
jgi:hypothetical protein